MMEEQELKGLEFLVGEEVMTKSARWDKCITKMQSLIYKTK